MQQICIKQSDEAVWFDNSFVARLKSHFNFIIVVFMMKEMIIFIEQKMNYYINKLVMQVKVALMNWNIKNKRDSMFIVREFFLPAVRISWMNFLSTGFNIINYWLEKNSHEQLNWTKTEYKKKKNLVYCKDFSFENHCFINKYFNIFIKNSSQLIIIKYLIMKKCAKNKILIFINEVVKMILIIKIHSVKWLMFKMILTVFL